MEIKRPDPEILLEQLQKEESEKNRGKLKIFFGYSAGVGKTYAMLEEAHMLKKSGIDVVIGYVEPHQRADTLALFEGLPQIPPLAIKHKSATFYEFDIDSALERHPQVILVDELAHTNAKGCRHAKRYQDIAELLRMGIDVYTTVNVQHIEGLHDVVEAITGVAVRERVPDHIFNSADKIELVDIEPEDLIERLNSGKIYAETQAKRALTNFFVKENLIALREIALRRTADRLNIDVEKNKNMVGNSSYFTGEHIMMCLSSSPSNGKVVRTAVKMAEAFHGKITALFVETSTFNEMGDENKKRLDENLRLAQQLGAKIVTVYGDDVAFQMAEYALASGVSKIVLGRPFTKRIFGFSSQNYVDRLTSYAPNLDVYVIPGNISKKYKKPASFNIKPPVFSISDTFKSIFCLIAATLVGYLFQAIGFSESNIITIYILASLSIAVITEGKIYSIVSSLFAVLMFNFFFTEPRYTLHAYNPDYPVTFLVMFLAALITSTYAKRVKEQARNSSLKAYRTEVLLETSQKLAQINNKNDIFMVSINQINKLLDKLVILYPAEGNNLGKAVVLDTRDREIKQYLTDDEYGVAQWVFKNNKHAGATTKTLAGAKCLYMAVRSGDKVFAVIGIAIIGGEKIGAFENSLLVAMLSECALTLEKQNILEANNKIMLQASSEQLRSSLLRAVSHDLRTPLTGIAGGSDFILESFDILDKETIRSVLTDISRDALWLSGLVENLLNITRINEGGLKVTKKNELVDEVISSAISKVIKRSGSRNIEIKKEDEVIFAPMDAQLILQVIINLLDNSFKHTKNDAKIQLEYSRKENEFILKIIDDGGGIPEEFIDKIFEPFFTRTQGEDKQRGAGLGLSICKSIAEAHGGSLKAENNEIGGATFIMTLPMD